MSGPRLSAAVFTAESGFAAAARLRRALTLVSPVEEEEATMPKYVIERDVPGVGKKTAAELRDVAKISCGVLHTLGPEITWVTSYVTGDKIYCVYIAPGEDMIREHARQGGFPANRISQVSAVIDRATAEG